MPAHAAGKPGAPKVDVIAPHPRPSEDSGGASPPQREQQIDLSHALPSKSLGKLPSSAEQLKTLTNQLQQKTPLVASAKEKSDALAAEAAALRKKLIDTAARIETLERDKIDEDARIVQLKEEDDRLSAGFAHDRVSVTRLIAVLERLQHDMPPALALKPDDALGAARGSMLIGASLPPVYARAASLARRIDALARTRRALTQQRIQADITEKALTTARADLAVLVARKEEEAAGAADTYGTLKTQLAVIASEAADFKTLLGRIARLRRENGADDDSVVLITSQSGGYEPLAKGSLRIPVVGTVLAPGVGPPPGLSFATAPGAQVIAPADGKVLFAGPYHKSGQVLILEITTGYDLVLAGLGRVSVRLNDELLAGEPVGSMPEDSGERLYFELRRDGKGLDPAPWLSLDLRKAKKT